MFKFLLVILLLLLSSCTSNKETLIEPNSEIKENEIIIKKELTTYKIYDYLDDESKKLYDKFYLKLLNFEEISDLVDNYILKIISLDHPELFYFDYIDGKVFYTMTKDEYLKKYEEIKILTASLKDDDELKTLVNVHDYIITNSSYNHSLSSDNFTSNNLINGSGNCYGYTKALKTMLDILEIENIAVFGIADQETSVGGHAFNVVKYDKNNYLIDTTWDSYIVSTYYSDKEITIPHYLFFLSDLPITHIPSEIFPDFKLKNYNYQTSIDNYSNSSLEKIADLINNSSNNSIVFKSSYDNPLNWKIIKELEVLCSDKSIYDFKIYAYQDFIVNCILFE